MAQVLVRQLGDEVVKELRRRARQHGRSLGAEIRVILTTAAKTAPQLTPQEALATTDASRAALAGRSFPSAVTLLRQDREA